jgi:hypothetical protein
MHEPPFSPTAAPYPVTIVLSPTRKDTTKRHWQQPLVTGLAERVRGDATEFLKWWPNYGYTERTVLVSALCEASYLVKSSPTDLTFENHLPGGFFVYRARDYDETERISRFHLACHPIIQSFGVLTCSP